MDPGKTRWWEILQQMRKEALFNQGCGDTRLVEQFNRVPAVAWTFNRVLGLNPTTANQSILPSMHFTRVA